MKENEKIGKNLAGSLNMWNTAFLSKFNAKLYNNVLSTNNVTTNEVSIMFNESMYFGFILHQENTHRKTKDQYFLQTDMVDSLPIIVTGKTKFSYKNTVYWFVKEAKSVQIPANSVFTFKQLVDQFAEYKHTAPKHWTLFKIIMLAGYFERLNIRIVSEASFGKDGVVDILQLLNGGVSNLYKATLAKMKYSLRNDLIIINELGALSSTDTADMQSYLLQAGAYKPTFENNSRATSGTNETEDLTSKTHVIFHNTPYYYENKNQKYFEQMFTPAVTDRFPALLLDGYVSEDFTKAPELDEVTEEQVNTLKGIISTLRFLKLNPLTKSKFNVNEKVFKLKGKTRQRTLRTMNVICKHISYYAETQEEFDEWVQLLADCYHRYKELME